MTTALRGKTGVFHRPDSPGERCPAAGVSACFGSAEENKLSVILFGTISIVAGGVGQAAFRYEKLKGLLAYLAMQPQMPLSRTFLAGLFWPELSADAGRQNLRQALFLLRSVLGDDVIESSRQTVRFVPGRRVGVDALFLEQAARGFAECTGCAGLPSCACSPEVALQGYRGPFAEGLTLPDCPEFERWLVARRESLHRCAVDFMARYVDWRSSQGAFQDALQWAMRYVDLEPWDEEGLQRLMRLYAQTGNSAAGLVHYQRFEKELLAELGIRPSVEIRALADVLRSGESCRPEIEPVDDRRVAPVAAERRQVTVVFCELSPNCEPEHEDMGGMFAARRDEFVRHLVQAGGRVVHNHGLSVLAYFGFPKTWEGAALSAANASFSAQRAVSDADLQCTVAIHTGMVTVGEGLEDGLCGHVSAAAMALAYAVPPGQIVVSDATLPQLRGAFVHEPQVPAGSPGRRHLPAHRLLRPRAGGRVAKRAGEPARTPRLVGRQGELLHLLGWWREARRGQGRLVQIVGEAGVGKTFLVGALRRRLAGSDAALLPLIAHRDQRTMPLGPVRHWLARRLPVRPTSGQAVTVARLRRLLRAVPASDGDLDDLARWLHDAPDSANDATHIVELLAALLGQVARQHPLLLTLDDVEFADAETLRLLDQLVATPGLPLLVVVTGRRTFGGRSPAVSLPLSPLAFPLDRELAESFLDSGRGGLPEWVEKVLGCCEGNPLFIEEFLVMGLRNGGRLQSASRQLIPSSLRDLMMARLDGLGVAKGVVQYASILGREFSLSHLAGLCGLTVGEIASYLEPLVEDGIFDVLPGEEEEDPRLVFCQNLLREAANQSLPRLVREALEARAMALLDPEIPAVTKALPQDLSTAA